MEPKAGRNDPCPCGSGKKYKQCCLGKTVDPLAALKRHKFTVQTAAPQDKPLSQPVNLMDRSFGDAVDKEQEGALWVVTPYPPSKAPEGRVSEIDPPPKGADDDKSCG